MMDLSWFREHRRPFRHFRAQNVFPDDVYQALASRFSEILRQSSAGVPGAYQLAQSSPNYDARILGVDDALARLFSPLFSMEAIQQIHGLMDFPFIPIVDGALHSSPVGSRTGWIHTDFCAAWFDHSIPPAGPFLYPRRDRCEYFSGELKTPGAAPRKYARAAALLFYLCNDGWRPGDGGETGLYGSQVLSSRSAVEFVPPLDNSLLLFECSPHSYHRFIHNPGRVRNSIILWIHATPELMQAKWGIAL